MDISDQIHRDISANRLIAKLPTITAMAYKYNMGQPFIYPRNDFSYAANFMHMMFATPCEKYEPNPVLVKALDRILILHADHEQNASTSTVRLAGSSGANPFACISAGIACLWGPAHGGANEACLNMLMQIGDVSRVGQYIERAKDKSDSFKLMGFGHRVYKNYDPRAKLMRETCHEVLTELGLRERSSVQARDGAGEDRARGRVFRREEAVSERGLLFGHRAEGARHSGVDVHGHLRDGAHGGLDRPVERNDRRSGRTRSAAHASSIPVPRGATSRRWKNAPDGGAATPLRCTNALAEETRMFQEMLSSSYLSGANAAFVEELYEQYLQDPASIDGDWRAYFEDLARQAGGRDVAHGPIVAAFEALAKRPPVVYQQAAAGDVALIERKQVSVLQLINAYRFLGVRHARVDPLERTEKTLSA